MRLSRAIPCAFVAILAVVVDAAAQPPAPATVAPQVLDAVPLFPSRHNLFDIPFQIDEAIPGQEPVEVQLHVSENRGTTWHLHAKAQPADGRFSFRAPRDGEYWFLVRTLNRQGRLLPERPFEPEMRVVVDSEPPTIELVCNRNASGEVVCTWRLNDPNLKPGTLQLTYQGIDSGPRWSTIGAGPSSPAGDGSWTGKATFVPSAVKPPIFVRVEVADDAGNRATAQSQVETPAGAGALALPSTAAERGPWTGSSKPEATSTLGGGSIPATPVTGGPASRPPATTTVPPPMADRFPGREVIPTPRGLPNAPTPYRPTTESRATETAPPVPETIAPGEAEALPMPVPQTTVTQRTLLPEATAPSLPPAPAVPSYPSPSAPSTSTPPASPTLPTPRPAAPATGPTLGSTGVEPALPSSPTVAPTPLAMPRSLDAETPPGITPRMVNSRRFELEYDIEAAGSAGIANVELWTTRDGGKSWTRSGTDPDGASPYVVNVPDEGVYGFRMVIETTTGLRTASPQPGDLPEVWVGVDVTKPTARFIDVRQGVGEQSGELLIEWQVSDEQLTPRPVGISFAEKAEGPWTTIATGLPAELDHYAWRLDARTPERLFIKLEARDVAGNVTTVVTPEPIAVERVRPQGRIRSVRPIGESARLRAPSQILPR